MFKPILQEIDSMMERDPSAKSRLEVALCYPGFHALLFYRLSHRIWKWRFYVLARWVSALARFLTGIEIHPAAKIGKRLFIDHGMGVVIGETAVIDDDVTLYHGVTLGGISPSIKSDSQREQKRHPTLGKGVIVGSGAQILGPVRVGENARIGSNAVVLSNVPGDVTVIGIPARIASASKDKDHPFLAYGLEPQSISDPLQRTIEGLWEEIHRLSNKLQEIEEKDRGEQTLKSHPPKKEAAKSKEKTGKHE